MAGQSIWTHRYDNRVSKSLISNIICYAIKSELRISLTCAKSDQIQSFCQCVLLNVPKFFLVLYRNLKGLDESHFLNSANDLRSYAVWPKVILSRPLKSVKVSTPLKPTE